MSLLKQYSTQLFLGSERKPAELPNQAGHLGDVCRAINASTDSIETQSLRIAASLHLYSQAGYCPPTFNLPMPEKCLTETTTVITDENIVQGFQQILVDGPISLLHTALIGLIQRAQLLPPKLLPAFFDLCLQSAEINAYLPLLMGNRGRWLLKANAHWNAQVFPANEGQLNQDDWDNGNFQQALYYIQQLRAVDADKARDLIIARLAELDARQRAELIEVISIQLSAADESFLEGLQKDRGKEVRNKAAALLTLIPKSQFVQRAEIRILPFLQQDKKLFRKHWSINIPEVFDAAWTKDTIEEKLPQSESLGQKAWWLYQLVLTLPLSWWEKTLALSAKDCVQWARESDWQIALLRAWQQACVREKNPSWAHAFLQMGSTKEFTLDKVALIDCLPLKEKMHAWTDLLNHKEADQYRQPIVIWICDYLVQYYQQHKRLTEFPFPAEFLRAFMKNITAYLFSKESRWDYTFRPHYLQILCLLPHPVLIDIVKSWPTQVEPNSAIEELLATAHRIVRIRTLFHPLASQEL